MNINISEKDMIFIIIVPSLLLLLFRLFSFSECIWRRWADISKRTKRRKSEITVDSILCFTWPPLLNKMRYLFSELCSCVVNFNKTDKNCDLKLPVASYKLYQNRKWTAVVQKFFRKYNNHTFHSNILNSYFSIQ